MTNLAACLWTFSSLLIAYLVWGVQTDSRIGLTYVRNAGIHFYKGIPVPS